MRTFIDDRGHVWNFGDGSYLRLDNQTVGALLEEGDEPVDDGYPGCEFRLPNRHGTSAVNIKVTGRTVRYIDGGPFVRVRVEFVGDCEESTFAGGFVAIY